MHYIIGLGNPGAEYDHTRHNIGRVAVELVREKRGLSMWEKDKHAQALVSRGADVTLVLPETYMNRSGETARYLVEKLGVRPEELIVIHDDIDLPLGTVRVAAGRGAGGHNGIRSIIDALGTNAFIRIRIGIAPTSFWTGAVKRPKPLEQFVLGRFSLSERRVAHAAAERVDSILEDILREGPVVAMNRYN